MSLLDKQEVQDILCSVQENGAGLYVNVTRYDYIAQGLLKKEEDRRRMPKRDFFIRALRA